MESGQLLQNGSIQYASLDSSSLKWYLNVHPFALTIICSIGLLANTLQFIVIIKSSLVKQTTGVYLRFLAVLDNIQLILHLVYKFLDVKNISSFLCKTTMIGGATFAPLSWLILLIMTIDRWHLCFVKANSGKYKPKRRYAFNICITTLIVTILYYSINEGIMFDLVSIPLNNIESPTGNTSMYIVDTSQNQTMGNIMICNVLPEYGNVYIYVHAAIDVIFWRFIAPLIVTCCNISIIRFLHKYSRFVSTNNTISRQIHENKITQMLVIITLCYVLLLVPSGVYFGIAPFIYDDASDYVSLQNPAFLVTQDILLINHSINFFLYILSAKRFRYEASLIFRSILRGCRRNH